MSIMEAIANLEQEMGGVVGVYGASMSDRTGNPVTYKVDEEFQAASTIKVFILFALLLSAQEGGHSLNDELTVTTKDKVEGSGVLKALTMRRSYTLGDLAMLMIIVSDNTATKLLIELLGVNHINAVIASRGWDRTRFTSIFDATTCPKDLADFCIQLWLGSLLNDTYSQIAKQIMGQQQNTMQLGRYLDFDPYDSSGNRLVKAIASKSGALRGVRNEVGVITHSGGQYVVSIMTKGCPDERYHVDNPGSLAVSHVSRLVFEAFRLSR